MSCHDFLDDLPLLLSPSAIATDPSLGRLHPVVVITEGYRRIPKDTESYGRLPKAGLKIEYRPIVSGVVANLELGDAWGSGGRAASGYRAGWGVRGRSSSEAESFFVFGYPKLSFVGGSSAAGSARVELLVETFASLAEPILREWRAIFISEKICREVVTK